jgi:hypothetical protein
MTQVFPGALSNMNKSSEVIANSPPGQVSGAGRPPTAITKCAAVTVDFFPLLSVHSSSWGLINLPIHSQEM